MRPTSFFDEIIDRGHFVERLMDSFRKIEEHIFSQMLMKERFIMDDVQMVINELFLDGPVIPLYDAVNPGAPWIDKQMGNLGLAEGLVELSKIL